MRQQPPFWHYTQKRNCFEHLAWSRHTKKNPSTGLGKMSFERRARRLLLLEEAVYLVSNLRCKGSDYFNNNDNNKVNKVKTIVYLDFI